MSTAHETAGDDVNLRCGMVALIGRANAGKSTLLNAVLEEKVSIVSPVAQTTRNIIRAVLTEPRGQLVFLDTPGVHKAEGALGKIMNRQARASVEGVDLALLVLDRSQPPRQEDEGWMRRLLHAPMNVMAVLNKADLPENCEAAHRERWEALCREKEVAREIPWLTVSALSGEGLEPLLASLFGQMPLAPPLFPADVLTDFPRKLAVADVIREGFFHLLHQELPHAIGVVVEQIDESEQGMTVEATVYVNRHSQKMIVLGTKGRLLRSVKRKAEKALGDIYGKPVSANLWIKIEPKWEQNFWLLKKMGYGC